MARETRPGGPPARREQGRGEPAAAFDQQPGQAALAETSQHVGKIDPAGGIGLRHDHLDPGVAQRLLARRIARARA